MNTTTKSNENSEQFVMGSLSLRDYFAAKAMASIVNQQWEDMPVAQVAEWAYVQADAMLERKDKK